MQNEDNINEQEQDELEEQDEVKEPEVLSFSLVYRSVPVKLTDKDDVTKDYTLTEVDGRKRDQFVDGVNKRMKYEKGEAVGLKEFQGLQASLVSLCLLNNEGTRVDAKIIQKYPSHVVTALFKKAKELNALTEEESLKAKND